MFLDWMKQMIGTKTKSDKGTKPKLRLQNRVTEMTARLSQQMAQWGFEVTVFCKKYVFPL